MHDEHSNQTKALDEVGALVVDACFCVHRALGPGLLENVYEQCVAAELESKKLMVQRQVSLPVTYRELRLDAAYRIDLLVEDCVVVEIKSVAELVPVHQAQLLTYLRLSGRRLGYLVNFNTLMIRNGIKRLIL